MTDDLPPLWRNRDFNLLWVGQALSSFGQQVSSVAYPLLVLALSGSAVRAGLVGSVQAGCTYVGGLIGGVAVDRYDRRVVIAVSDGARALAMSVVVVTVMTHVVGMGVLIGSGAVNGLFALPVNEAVGAALMRVVPHAQTEQSVALDQARSAGAGVAGNGLGGLLFAVGNAVPFLADALSYLVSLGTALAVRTSLAVAPRAPGERNSLKQELAAGARWLRERPALTATVTAASFANFSLASADLVVIVLSRRHGASSGEIGLALAIGSAGGIIGALTAARIVTILGRGGAGLAALWVQAALMPFFALAPGFLSLGLIFAGMAFWVPIANVVVGAKLWRAIPDELRGRVMALLTPMNAGLGALGPLVGGVLLESLGSSAPILLAIPSAATATIITSVGPLRAFVIEPLASAEV